MSIITFTGAEAPSMYPPDLHPGYWCFPEGGSIYTGIIQDIREEKAYQGKPGTNLVIQVVNGAYHGRINLNTHTTPRAELSRVMGAMGALEYGKPSGALLPQAIGKAVCFTLNQFQSQDGLWHPVLRFGAMVPHIIPLPPGRNFGWSRPETLPQELRPQSPPSTVLGLTSKTR
jgi:hypothetical protein